MMFEIRMPTKPIAAAPRELVAIVSPTSFDSEYEDSGRGSMVSSIGANAGGTSNGRPRTVSLEAHTTRFIRWATAAWKTL